MKLILTLYFLGLLYNVLGQNSFELPDDSFFRVNKVKQRKIVIESKVNSGVTIIDDFDQNGRLQKSTTCYDNHSPFCPQNKIYKYDSSGKLTEILNVNLNPIKESKQVYFMPLFYERFEYDSNNRLIRRLEVDSNNYTQTDFFLDYSARTKTENYYNLEHKISTQNFYKLDLYNNIIMTKRCFNYSQPTQKCDSFETKNVYDENRHLVRMLTERENYKEDIRFSFNQNGSISYIEYFGKQGLFQKRNYTYSYWNE